MTMRRVLASAALAVTCVTASDSPQPGSDTETAATGTGADAYLETSVLEVGRRIAAIVRRDRAPSVEAVRADEATRAAEVQAEAQRVLPTTRGAARGRAWGDLGFGTGTEPLELVAAIASDAPGMNLDAARARLLVDPKRLLPETGRGNPDEDPDAAILLATGVAPDEPLAGHYLAHALLDGSGLESPVTTDALLARQAMAEGAANLAALVLLFDGVGLESEVLSGALRPEEMLGGSLVSGAMRSATPVVAHLLEFVYLDGFAQAATIARKGGFVRLAQERKVRRTTRDVLHLELAPAPPTEIPAPVLPAELGLSPVDRDSLGEQGIISWVSLLTGKDNLGLITGDGWVADSLWRFEPTPGPAGLAGEGATIWITRWKNDQDANDFSYAVERCLQARFPGENPSDDPARGGQVLRRVDRMYRIERTGVQVVFQVLTPAIDSKLGPSSKKKGPSAPPSAVKK
jgi:hypothetical protein